MRNVRSWFGILALITFISTTAQMRVSQAGGGWIKRLSFPNANNLSCGTWQVDGDYFTDAKVDYQLTDGNGTVLYKESLPNLHGSGIIFAGSFDVQPKKNPITFSIRNVPAVAPADNPCLPPTIVPPIDLQGKIAFSAWGRLYVTTRRDSNGEPLLSEKAATVSQEFPSWSPDGKKLAFLEVSSTESQIFVCDADGKNVRQLTTSHAQKSAPVWSPDGQRLAFAEAQFTTKDGIYVLYTVNVDGTAPKRLTSNNVYETAPAWSPDGKRIAFWSNLDQHSGFYVVDSNGGTPQFVSATERFSLQESAWSPDGQSIIFSNRENGYVDIYIVNIDGSNLRRLTDNVADYAFPVWSPDGKHIVFARGKIYEEACDMTVFVMQPDGSNQTAITDRKIACNLGIDVPNFAWSPDSKQVVFLAYEQASYDQWTLAIASLDGSPTFSITTPDIQPRRPTWTR